LNQVGEVRLECGCRALQRGRLQPPGPIQPRLALIRPREARRPVGSRRALDLGQGGPANVVERGHQFPGAAVDDTAAAQDPGEGLQPMPGALGARGQGLPQAPDCPVETGSVAPVWQAFRGFTGGLFQPLP
jgi:hypothetical protein